MTLHKSLPKVFLRIVSSVQEEAVGQLPRPQRLIGVTGKESAGAYAFGRWLQENRKVLEL